MPSCDRREFQSLLWWIGRVNSRADARAVDRRDVSILVVVDWSRQRRHSGRSGVEDGFQSLLWWIGRVNQPDWHRLHAVLVSILVVVDWSRQRSAGRSARRSLSFNPCCGGLVASTRRAYPSSDPSVRFNPCCGGLVASTVRRCPDARQACFNPCCGGLVASTATPLHGCDHRRVSILVVVDWSRQLAATASTAGSTGFNPCCGGLVASTREDAARLAEPGFNPCCGGLVASTVERRRGEGSTCFNPCCGGLVASTVGLSGPARRPSMFQSLLWWIGRVNAWRSSCGVIGQGMSFNPCCGGLVASTTCRPWRRDGMDDRVSILVVVDWSRQRDRRHLASRRHAMFQSLLWWIGRVNGGRMTCMECIAGGFNPCCGGLVASTTHSGSRRSPSFNPCCGGLVASTRRLAHECNDVSILVVVDWSRQQRSSPAELGQHVSILVVVDWSRQLGPSWIAATIGFQSLLWWIGRVNRECQRPLGRCPVSILVVVDWSRQPTLRAGSHGRIEPCFNPCCGGLVASTAPNP